MKPARFLALMFFALRLGAVEIVSQPAAGDYTENYDTIYNSLTVQREGSVVELRARSRRGEFRESAVDLDNPLHLIVPYTRTLFAAEFFQPRPTRVLMIGLGGAAFHRVFVTGHPDALLQSVELDPKVFELCKARLAFQPTDKSPVAIMDGRMYVKRSAGKWDWLILDAFRGGFVPPHLKTEEFYRECAAHLSERGVFVSNLHATTALYYADLKTIAAVFPQVVLFETAGTGNVIACAVNYRTPIISDPSKWTDEGLLARRYAYRIDFEDIRHGRIPFPTKEISAAKVLTDDFAPVEFLNALRTNNATSE
jgi:spermidine synthase